MGIAVLVLGVAVLAAVGWCCGCVGPAERPLPVGASVAVGTGVVRVLEAAAELVEGGGTSGRINGSAHACACVGWCVHVCEHVRSGVRRWEESLRCFTLRHFWWIYF